LSVWYVALNWIFDHNVLGFSHTILNKMGHGGEWVSTLPVNPLFIQAKYEVMAMIFISYAMGASVLAMISRIGGGIFMTATRLGTENAFIESSIDLPEDDIRNSGVLAEFIGRHVSGVSGVLSGLMQLMAVSVGIVSYLAAYNIDVLAYSQHSDLFVLPFVLIGCGLISQTLTLWSLKFWKKSHVSLISRGQILSVLINSIACLLLIAGQSISVGVGTAALIGVVGSHALVFLMSRMSQAPTIKRDGDLSLMLLRGFEKGLKKAMIPVVGIVAMFASAYYVGNGLEVMSLGMYAVSVCAISGISSGLFSKGVSCAQPIVSTSVSLSKMLQESKTTAVLVSLDGQVTGTKVGSDAESVVSLFLLGSTSIFAVLISIKHWTHKLAGDYGETIRGMFFSNDSLVNHPDVVSLPTLHIFDLAHLLGVSLVNPQLIIGVLMGGAAVCVITYFCIARVIALSSKLSLRIRTEFLENPKIAQGEVLPDYGEVIHFVTGRSVKAVGLPFLVSGGGLLVASICFGITGSIGYLLGTLLSMLTLYFIVGQCGTYFKQCRPSHPHNNTLRMLSNVFAVFSECIQPVLNTAIIWVFCLSVFVGLFTLKCGHLLGL
jgi:K(+)-stimulated pyrophosphate-energized sodium pump